MSSPELYPYQIEGADWLAANPRAGLGDEPGLGKSAQAIRAMDKVGAQRAIIIAPAGAHRVGVWANEHKKFSTIKRKLLKPRDITDLSLWTRGKVDVLLLSYELASKWSKHLSGDLIDAVVIDEGHYLKGAYTQRTRAILGANCRGENGLAKWGVYVWPLSGTFAANDPLDYWTWLRFLGGTTLNLRPFTDRYFKTTQGTFSQHHNLRQEMIPELRQAVKSVIKRRTLDDAGIQLPPIWTTTKEIDGDKAEVVSFMRQWPGLDDQIVEAIDKGGLSFLDSQHVATLRRLIGEAKAPAYIELITEELNNGLDKVVIMGLHVACLQTVRRELERRGFKGVQVVGGISDKQGAEADRQFREDPACRYFIGNLQAAGTALTLTSADHIDLLEQWWSPAVNAQAIKRVHRIGQGRPVHARLISLAGSFDERLTEILERKVSAILRVEGKAA